MRKKWKHYREKGISMVAVLVKNPPAKQETQVQSLGGEDPLENKMATPIFLAWRIPWTGEPGRPMGSQRVRYE